MNQFVKFGCRLTVPPPIVCKNAILYELHVKADFAKLGALCDTVFGNSSVRCEPLQEDAYVVVRFGSIEWVGPDSRVVNGINAGVQEEQIIFQVPVKVHANNDSVYAHFSPFIWVDNALSLVGGREVFGYPKSLGEFKIEDGPSLTLSTYKKSDKSIKSQVLIKIKYTDDAPENFDLKGAYQEWYEAWLNGGRATEIFFKQFNAIDSNFAYDAACFQQIAIAEYEGADLKPSDLKGSFNLTIEDSDIFPLFQDLGVETSGRLKGWKLNGDFTIGHPRVLWQMPVPALLPGTTLSRCASKALV